MKSFYRLFFGLLLMICSVAHAEGECPPGMFPTNPSGAQGPVGCAPIPGYNQQQQQQQQAQPQQQAPPPLWDSRWLAIATDSIKGSLGTANDMANKSEAEQTAMTNCRSKGGMQCKVDVSFGNGCAAMVSGNTGYNVQGAPTLDQATQVAMKTCNKATTHCHVYYSVCSLPVRIQ